MAPTIVPLPAKPSRDEFLELTRVAWLIMGPPSVTLLPLAFPILPDPDHPDPAADRERALQASVDVMYPDHLSNPDGRWVKVVDPASATPDTILGLGRCVIHTSTPPPPPTSPSVQKQWPDDGRRDFATWFMSRIGSGGYRSPSGPADAAAAAETISRPHRERPNLYIEVCGTSPDHKRRGVGGMVMAYFLRIADELRLDSTISATREGRLLYEKYGFEVVVQNTFEEPAGEHRPGWEELAARTLPYTSYDMLRKCGKAYPGKPETA